MLRVVAAQPHTCCSLHAAIADNTGVYDEAPKAKGVVAGLSLHSGSVEQAVDQVERVSAAARWRLPS